MVTDGESPVKDHAVFIVSRSLRTLNSAETTTSSQRYELGLATEMARTRRTRIVGLRATHGIESGDLALVALGNGSGRFRSFVWLAWYLVHHCRRGTRVIAFGYEPGMVLALSFARLRGARAFSIIFDTHVGALAHMRRVKAAAVHLYFRIGRRLLRLINGVIVVTDRARTALERYHPNVLLSRLPLQRSAEPYWEDPPASRTFRIVFAGSLEEYNGIRELVKAVRSLNTHSEDGLEFELLIFGAGSCVGFVKDAAGECADIVYEGVATQSQVSNALRAAHIGVNTRDPDHPVQEYAFPSKLIDLMGFGIPVLTSDIAGSNALDDYVNLLPSIDATAIAEGIRHIADDYPVAVLKARTGIRFVECEYKLHDVVSEIAEFIGLSGPDRSGDGP